MKDKIFMYLVMNTWLERDNIPGMAINFGWGNGYVAVPAGHPWYQQDYDNIECSAHGGLTYSGQHGEYWVVGFDTGHHKDTLERWPMEAVLEETKNLMKQAQDVCK